MKSKVITFDRLLLIIIIHVKNRFFILFIILIFDNHKTKCSQIISQQRISLWASLTPRPQWNFCNLTIDFFVYLSVYFNDFPGQKENRHCVVPPRVIQNQALYAPSSRLGWPRFGFLYISNIHIIKHIFLFTKSIPQEKSIFLKNIHIKKKINITNPYFQTRMDRIWFPLYI